MSPRIAPFILLLAAALGARAVETPPDAAATPIVAPAGAATADEKIDDAALDAPAPPPPPIDLDYRPPTSVSQP
jgi:hypothetical protein